MRFLSTIEIGTLLVRRTRFLAGAERIGLVLVAVYDAAAAAAADVLAFAAAVAFFLASSSADMRSGLRRKVASVSLTFGEIVGSEVTPLLLQLVVVMTLLLQLVVGT